MKKIIVFFDKHANQSGIFKRLFWLVFLALAVLACNFSKQDQPRLIPTTSSSHPYPSSSENTPLPESEVTFRLEVPEDTLTGDKLKLELLDEVTGLSFNPYYVDMKSQGGTLYSATIRLPVGAVVKYRFSRWGDRQINEFLTNGQPVRYRIYPVDGPGVVNDVVSRWADTQAISKTGRIFGEVVDTMTGFPVPNILVTAGGVHAISAANGTFLLDELPAGLHNLVGYAMDGRYKPFKQNAVVLEDAATPATLSITHSPSVEVIFTVQVPPDTVPGVPVRIAGNLLQFGNTFADLSGNISTLANRMPKLRRLSDGSYRLSITLPKDVYLRYKYTMGDGLWNAETNSDGTFRTRQLVVPSNVDTYEVEDSVVSWSSVSTAPVTFDVQIPDYTPKDDRVYLQFKLYEWMEPIPIWQAEDYRWGFKLSSPTNIMGDMEYRYCRNAQCGGDFRIAAEEYLTPRFVAINQPEPQTHRETMIGWHWFEPREGAATILGHAIQPRDEDFIAGVEILPDYHPSWDQFMPSSLANIKGMHANWVTLTPTWSFTNNYYPNLTQIPGKDILWNDIIYQIKEAQDLGMHTALYPHPNFQTDYNLWWQFVSRDEVWWNIWFERYRTFLIHHAMLAHQTGVEKLILGGPWLTPALPGSTLLADGSPTNVPSDAETRWQDLILEIRSHFHGVIAWALPFSGKFENSLSFLDSVDEIHIDWYTPLSTNPYASEPELEAEAGRLLDEVILPIQLQLNKPVILNIAYPSAHGAVTGCITVADDVCLSPLVLSPTNQNQPAVELDLQEQVEVYNAMFAVVNERSWISGIVSQGFYPPVSVEDRSISVHGKPAQDVIRYWFSSLLPNSP
jgi:hypothetical protein